MISFDGSDSGEGPFELFAVTVNVYAVPLVRLALAGHPHEAGTAASVLGVLNFGVAGVLPPLVGVFGIHNAIAMGSRMFVTSLIAVLALWIIVRPRTVPALER